MFEQGTPVSILIGGAVTNGAVCTRFVHGIVTATTVKAIQVRFDSGDTIWLPKKALIRGSGDYYKLARWFRASDFQWRVFERNESISGISA